MSEYMLVRVLGVVAMVFPGVAEYLYLKKSGKSPDMKELTLTLKIAAFLVVAMALREQYISPHLEALRELLGVKPFFSVGQNPWVTFFVLIIVFDFMAYWMHRFSHQVRFLWAGHSCHHSPKSIFLGVGQRISFVEAYLYAIILNFPLSLFFGQLEVDVVSYVNLLYQFYLHTELGVAKKMPFISYIFNTPSHHCVHHSIDDKYINKNFGGIFIVWDRLFGTFLERGPEKLTYGLKGIKHHQTAVEVLFHPFVMMAKFMMFRMRSHKSGHFKIFLRDTNAIYVGAGSDDLRTILIKHNVPIPSFCGGNGICGRCRVVVKSGEMSDLSPDEQELLSDSEKLGCVRLACQTYPQSNASVFLNRRKKVRKLSASAQKKS